MLGLLAVVAAAAGWGLAGIFASLTHASGIVLTFWRMWIGAGLLFGLAKVSGRTLTLRALRISVLGGILLAADMTLFFSAIRLTSIAVATVVSALQPVLVMVVAGPLLGEKVSARDALSTAVAIVGVVTVVVGAGVPGHGALTGDLFAVGSLVAWSAYFVVAKLRVRPPTGALEYTFGVTAVGAVVMVPVLFASGQSLTEVHGTGWIYVVALAVVPGSAHVLMNWAHHSVDASVSSVIGSANPVVAVVAARIVLHQQLNAVQIAGGAVALGAVAVIARRHRFGPQSPVE